MKKLLIMKKIILLTFFVLCSTTKGFTQFIEAEEVIDKHIVTIGINAIDNKNNQNSLPFSSRIDLNSSLFLGIERKLKLDCWSIQLNVSTNNLLIKETHKFYISTDILANYSLDKLIFKSSQKLNTFIGFGTGLQTLKNNNQVSLIANLGLRYWFEENFAITIQSLAKMNNKVVNDLASHAQILMGISFRLKTSPDKSKTTSIKEKKN